MKTTKKTSEKNSNKSIYGDVDANATSNEKKMCETKKQMRKTIEMDDENKKQTSKNMVKT